MNPDGANIYEPSEEDREAIARRYHPKLTWATLHDEERRALLTEWRVEQLKKEPPKQTHAPLTTTHAVSQTELMRVVDAVAKLIELQPLAAKGSAHLAVRTVGRVLRPILERERRQRADLQQDLSQMRREWAEQSRRFNDLLSGLLAELCMHKRDENDERAERLDELEERVDAAIAELARR